MYQIILDSLEPKFEVAYDMDEDYKKLGEMLDLIIKIKTIQAMDVSAELIRESRRILRN